jgi:hypothetical protein
MAYLFQSLLKEPATMVEGKNHAKSLDWLAEQVRSMRPLDTKRVIDDVKQPFYRLQTISESAIGKMYLFIYDAKTKDKLPYWDRYPLIFPIEYYNNGFLGINLHYLSPIDRASLMSALYDTINNNNYDKTTKLQISYDILKNSSQLSYFKPCIKRYLFSHVKSTFIYISPEEWDVALMLPLARFMKASQTTVWRDSANKVK